MKPKLCPNRECRLRAWDSDVKITDRLMKPANSELTTKLVPAQALEISREIWRNLWTGGISRTHFAILRNCPLSSRPQTKISGGTIRERNFTENEVLTQEPSMAVMPNSAGFAESSQLVTQSGAGCRLILSTAEGSAGAHSVGKPAGNANFWFTNHEFQTRKVPSELARRKWFLESEIKPSKREPTI